MNLQKYLPDLLKATAILRFNPDIVNHMILFWKYPRSENIVDTIYYLCVFKIEFYEKLSDKIPNKSEVETKKMLLMDILGSVAIYFSGDYSDKNERFLEIVRYMDLSMGEVLEKSDFEWLLEHKNKGILEKLRDIQSQM